MSPLDEVRENLKRSIHAALSDLENPRLLDESIASVTIEIAANHIEHERKHLQLLAKRTAIVDRRNNAAENYRVLCERLEQMNGQIVTDNNAAKIAKLLELKAQIAELQKGEYVEPLTNGGK